MMQRQPLNETLPEALKRADDFFALGRFFDAFGGYKRVLELPGDASLSLFCKVRMLFCQYHTKSIRPALLVSRLASLMSELAVESNVSVHNKALLQACYEQARFIQANLIALAQRRMYLSAAVEQLIKQSEAYELRKHLQIRELDATRLTYEADYLIGWFDELAAAGMGGALIAHLAEIIGDAYNMRTDDFPDDAYEIKKLLLGMAKEAYERAMLCWRGVDLSKERELLLVVLHLMEELYSIAVIEQNEVDKARVFRDYGSLLATTRGWYVSFYLHHALESARTWYNQTSAELTVEKRESLDKLLMPPPRAVLPRSNRYAAGSPSFFIHSDAPIEIPVEAVVLPLEAPTGTM